MSTNNNQFGLVIVGDELLSGKRRDGHFQFMVKTLRAHGGELAWVRLIGDDLHTQVETYRQTHSSGLPVFSFGGIGATPDDLTRQAAATAFERDLDLHPEGLRILGERFGNELTDLRRQLVNFPRDSELIPNPINRIPGFSLNDHFFVPGFPNMAWPMVEWVLAQYFPAMGQRPKETELRLQCSGVYESDLIPVMQSVLDRHPEIKLSCLPASSLNRQAEIGIRGSIGLATPAFQMLRQLLEQQNIQYQLLDDAD